MAEKYGQRPSVFFNIRDEYVAWCFDEAVYSWGSYVVTQLNEVDGKNKQQIEGRQKRLLQRLLHGWGTPPMPMRS